MRLRQGCLSQLRQHGSVAVGEEEIWDRGLKDGPVRGNHRCVGPNCLMLRASVRPFLADALFVNDTLPQRTCSA